SAPWTFAWNGATAGTYTLTARATDNDGVSTTSSPVNVRVNAPPGPTSVSAPATAYAAPASFTLTATTSDSEGIQRVEFLRNGVSLGSDATAPYQWSVSSLAAGTYTFTAKAFDTDGISRESAAFSVTVSAAPAVAITSPASGLQLSPGESVAISGTASDSDGT